MADLTPEQKAKLYQEVVPEANKIANSDPRLPANFQGIFEPGGYAEGISLEIRRHIKEGATEEQMTALEEIGQDAVQEAITNNQAFLLQLMMEV